VGRCIDGSDKRRAGSIDCTGLKVDWDDLFSLPKDYWTADAAENRGWLERQVGPDLPAAVHAEMEAQEARIKAM
jgi:phosphoenolpyruvate carboxykinase (GTP)